ncbi:class I SAM-dependent methyltransferase [Haliovirga abyssi]|uniref:SAM-dependent methyltransferase n=1 Tax=Haliovirga abyssi TaxID=2996794 RepID=A0AAU9E3C5_9FUSO|nr:class I SAM-dependent methyltransferase [Haliovirga abyssi]BDU50955.1 SAM-dependent methyltransferase [Haliovirga abyssi]
MKIIEMKEKKKIDKIKNHFEEEAKEFDGIILKLIPFYKEMLEALILSIPFEKNSEIEVIDLGCGTGNILDKVKKQFPNAKLTAVDLSKNMIEMTKIKLEKYNDVDYYVGDFYNFEFLKKYDVILSSLALHHLVTDEDKKIFYNKIYNALSQNGVFYNADVVLGSNYKVQDVYMNKWIEFMKKSCSIDEIENIWLEKYQEEDSPTTLINHLNWLEEIGFKDIDVIWKYYNYSVYGGKK